MTLFASRYNPSLEIFSAAKRGKLPTGVAMLPWYVGYTDAHVHSHLHLRLSLAMRSLNTLTTVFASLGSDRPFRAFVGSVVVFLLLLGGIESRLGYAQQANSVSIAAAPTPTSPSGHVQFLGLLTEAQAAKVAVANDSCIIRVNRRLLKESGGLSPREYYYILTKRIDPVEGRMLADAMDGQWNSFDQLHAALIAEGLRSESEIRSYEARVETMLQELRATLVATQTADTNAMEVAQAKVVFEYLHRHVLTGEYQVDCSQVSSVFKTGDFNCVSATVLFNVLSERLGLQATGLEKPGHVLSRVHGREKSFDVETTCPNWFSLTGEVRVAGTIGKTAHAVGQPLPAGPLSAGPLTAEAIAKVREITPVQLVAMIYYNEGVDEINAKNYDLAAAANAKALLLDASSDAAWSNLMATINNWAIDFATNQKRFDLAARLLDEGRSLDATYSNFESNQLNIYYHWIQSLISEGRTADAKTVYAHAAKRLAWNAELARLIESIP